MVGLVTQGRALLGLDVGGIGCPNLSVSPWAIHQCSESRILCGEYVREADHLCFRTSRKTKTSIGKFFTLKK